MTKAQLLLLHLESHRNQGLQQLDKGFDISADQDWNRVVSQLPYLTTTKYLQLIPGKLKGA